MLIKERAIVFKETKVQGIIVKTLNAQKMHGTVDYYL